MVKVKKNVYLIVCFDVAAEGGGVAEGGVEEGREAEENAGEGRRVAEGQRFGASEGGRFGLPEERRFGLRRDLFPPRSALRQRAD